MDNVPGIEVKDKAWSLVWEGLRRSLDLIYPPQCAGCRSNTQAPHGLCPHCWAETGFLVGAMCSTCAQPLPGMGEAGLSCDACLSDPPPWVAGAAAVSYEGAARRAILSFKHGDRLDLVPTFCGWLGRAAAPLLPRIDLVASVPLHQGRLWTRGFNQSAELARAFSKEQGLNYVPSLLVRTKPTGSMRGLTKPQRQAVVKGAFKVANGQSATRVTGANILLVDDVMTTGATLGACAEALLEQGAASVKVLCVARVEGQKGAVLPDI